MESHENSTSFGPRTEKAMNLVSQKKAVFSGGERLSAEYVSYTLAKFASFERGMLFIPGGEGEPDGIQVGLRAAVIQDVIEKAQMEKMSKSRGVLLELSRLDEAEVGFDRETGEISTETYEDGGIATVSFNRKGAVQSVDFDLGDGMGDIFFYDNFVTGMSKDQIMFMAAIASHNKRIGGKNYSRPSISISSGEKQIGYSQKGIDAFWDSADKVL